MISRSGAPPTSAVISAAAPTGPASGDVIEPTAVHAPGSAPEAGDGPPPDPTTRRTVNLQPASGLAPPAPLVAGVGDIAGLRPRRARRDGGEVPGADVDLVDALDRLTWNVVAAWLADCPLASTRRTRLQVLTAFLRWLLGCR
ncbi:hypothetical protein [Nonomuraea sp. NPDC003804]|uniref:hypothetical protein n=1 Tax=Nonomuraea sp. NPDC003804 TaxID=3154547 RepID=UPI0033BEFCA0